MIFVAWFVGLVFSMSAVGTTMEAMEGSDEGLYFAWWTFPLMALAVVAATFIIGAVLVRTAFGFISGVLVGAVLNSIFVAFLVSEDPLLYLFGCLASVPVIYWGWNGQRERFRMLP